jgi:antitoxin (DNA-binding transcriptional repressor) of toxin-antitoxin stability system
MKTVVLQQSTFSWPEILSWVSAGEEVEIKDFEKTIARVVPPRPTVDFLQRAKQIWSEDDSVSLSELVHQNRGDA